MAEDRLDRIERNLERYAEESNQRMTRLKRFLANFSKDVARNAADANERLDRIEKLVAHNTEEGNLRIRSAEVTLDRLAELLNRSFHQSNERLDRIEKQTARNAQLIERNGQQIQFLRELTQGHISQPKPPAHSD